MNEESFSDTRGKHDIPQDSVQGSVTFNSTHICVTCNICAGDAQLYLSMMINESGELDDL